MRKLSIFALALSILAVSCNKGTAVPEASGEIRVDASIGTITKVSYDGNKSAFEKDDDISVYAWMGDASTVPTKKVVDGVVNTFDGEVWTPAIQMLWKTVVDPHYFIGIYPAREVSDFKADPYEQMPKDYELSDLLIATNVSGVKASDGKVSLAFDHVMSKLQVNLNFRSQWNDDWDPLPEIGKVSVYVKAVTVGTVDYLAKVITPSKEVDVKAISLFAMEDAAQGYTYSFENLVIPQEGIYEITVMVGEKILVYTHTANEKGISLEKGKVTTIGLKLGREQLDLEGISVDDWTEGTMPATDGDAEVEEED